METFDQAVQRVREEVDAIYWPLYLLAREQFDARIQGRTFEPLPPLIMDGCDMRNPIKCALWRMKQKHERIQIERANHNAWNVQLPL